MTTAHDFSFTTIEGKPLKLSEFAGKAVLLVNTASACGLTPQYKGLQELWDAKKDGGLVVLGVPSNDFGAQEPGTEAEVKDFCEARFGVSFPLTSKNPVIGAEAHPLYKWIGEQTGEAGLPKWNFHKYLIAKDGTLAGTFGSMTAPEAPELTAAIDKALGA
ncbi:Hydroperoxy fatty acid reductase gpx1 [Alphaproteobacteria bacterium SO-S41]|nr:Hydroperoxy fatty acid reductase gpx1 [Alphaproteobacteria bacterium SO-S41]